MNLQTEIKINPLEQTIHYADGLLFLGSCFADEVGALCRGLGFDALVNPFGVLYNPASIAQSVERLNSGKPFCHDDVIRVGERQCCTFSHNTAFWNTTEEALLQQVNQSLAEAHAHFLDSKWVVISLGTSWVFRNKETQEVVSNCHKLPAYQFERQFLSVEQCYWQWMWFAKSMATPIISPPTKSFWTNYATIVFTRKIWCIPPSRLCVTFGNASPTLPLTQMRNSP